MRVVGGKLKGRNLASPSGREIRPTADRLRESVFNILIHGDRGRRIPVPQRAVTGSAEPIGSANPVP